MLTGYSPLLVIVGDETGIGKSMLGARIAELVYKEAYNKVWKPDGHLFFKMSEFRMMHVTSDSKIFIIEEAEIELGSDEWQSIQNKWFSRIKSTQRIKGNLYILILPIFMQLARKHRRAVNYLYEVKDRGFFRAYKVKKRASQLLGDEMSKVHIGDCLYRLPDCKKEYDELDIINKQRIEKEENEKLEEILMLKEAKKDKIKYRFTCPYCNCKWDSFQNPSKSINKKCPLCKKLIFHDDKTVQAFRVLR